MLPAKQAALGKMPVRWTSMPLRIVGVTPFRQGFLLCAAGGSLTYLAPGKSPARFAPKTPKSMPQMPLQNFWVDSRGRPNCFVSTGSGTMAWGFARWESGSWTVVKGDRAPSVSLPPAWPELHRSRMTIPLGNGRFRDLSKSIPEASFCFELQSVDPSLRAFVFNPQGEGESRIALVRNGQVTLWRTDHIEAAYRKTSILVTPNRVVSYSISNHDVFSLQPWQPKGK